MDIALEVFSPSAYKTYAIRFANETLALAWIAAHTWEPGYKGSYHTGEATDYRRDNGRDIYDPIKGCRFIDAAQDPNLYALLNPVCEHGMSGNLCAGPNHYPADDTFI